MLDINKYRLRPASATHGALIVELLEPLRSGGGWGAVAVFHVPVRIVWPVLTYPDSLYRLNPASLVCMTEL